jgi:glucose-1-phosphate cytidylyltransferase
VNTLILCGGKGTRAYPHTAELPKPLLPVGGQPVLRHVMDIFAAQGFTDFVLAAGYRAELVEEFAADLPGSWDVQVVDTGEETNTGARVALCRRLLSGTFLATYGDGLADIDLRALIARHRGHPGAATLTTVPLPSQYGTIECGGDDRVDRFVEKPTLLDRSINAGFFVFDQDAFAWWSGDDLERQVLPALGAAGRLYAYRHNGFWKSLDTYKDALELSELCETTPDNPKGTPPWMRFAAAASS